MKNNKQQSKDSIKLGTIEEFHSKKCFDLYMYAVKFAEQINSYLERGYLVFEDNDSFKNKFVFYGISKPYIAIKVKDCSLIYFGNSFDEKGLVWLDGETTKKSIREKFLKFKIVEPCNIKTVSYTHLRRRRCCRTCRLARSC